MQNKNPEGNTAGTWAWADGTTIVGTVGDHTFKANFTPMDSANYNGKSNVDVTVTVNKAGNPATVTNTATVMKGGNTVDLANNVTKNGATGAVSYEISGDAKGCSLNGSVLISGNDTGSVTVNVAVAEDGNYNALAETPITVTISDKRTQTISADDVTTVYGDTGKKVTARTDGNGAISYAVKEGSGDYIAVDASTGALTIKKVPADGKAYVTVTAAETDTYKAGIKDVTVTINKANAVAATVTANNRICDGTEQPLVTITDETTGGTLKLAVTTENKEPAADAYRFDITSIPTGTDEGTYYVWYKVVGDDNHNDTVPVPVEVTIDPKFYSIDVNITGNGSVVVDPATEAQKSAVYYAQPGKIIRLTVTPDSGYELRSLTYTTGSGDSDDITEEKSFEMPAADVTVDAVFEKTADDQDHPVFSAWKMETFCPGRDFPRQALSSWGKNRWI